MTDNERIDKIETRVDRLESAFESKLDAIFAKLNTLAIDTVRNACPKPGACIGLSNDLEHAVRALNASLLRVERLELKILEVDRMCVSGFHKIETQKAWILGAWSVVAFCASALGAIATILVNYYISK
jgi:hypothetical protein